MNDSLNVDNAVVTVLRDLVFRHHEAARRGDEESRRRLFDMTADLEHVYPFSALTVFGERNATQSGTTGAASGENISPETTPPDA